MTCDRLVVSSTNKTDRHDITEILLKVALNTIYQPTILLLVRKDVNERERLSNNVIVVLHFTITLVSSTMNKTHP